WAACRTSCPALCSPRAYISFQSLLLYRHAVLRDLHSFPTRRSSDLHRTVRRGRKRSACRRGRQGSWRRLCGGPVDWSSWCGSLRSEEHTSELQSRENLVCRLLLEKKKKSLQSAADHMFG